MAHLSLICSNKLSWDVCLITLWMWKSRSAYILTWNFWEAQEVWKAASIPPDIDVLWPWQRKNSPGDLASRQQWLWREGYRENFPSNAGLGGIPEDALPVLKNGRQLSPEMEDSLQLQGRVCLVLAVWFVFVHPLFSIPRNCGRTLCG